jgi:hypothetical protein
LSMMQKLFGTLSLSTGSKSRNSNGAKSNKLAPIVLVL